VGDTAARASYFAIGCSMLQRRYFTRNSPSDWDIMKCSEAATSGIEDSESLPSLEILSMAILIASS